MTTPRRGGGPPPKRDAERRRVNKPVIDTTTVDIGEKICHKVEIPTPDETWGPIATAWYESLQHSGQAMFYEPSDWMTAFLIAEQMDRELSPHRVVQVGYAEDGTSLFETIRVPINGASLNSILKGMGNLMTTEGDRRRLRIELERNRAEAEALPKGVSNIETKRQDRLG